MKIKIKSKIKKGKYIHGILLKNRKSKTLVIFMSGFSGGRDSKLFKNASNVFLKKDFDTLQFNFFQEKGRGNALRPEELSFSFYVSELKNIIDYFKKEYLEIILVGHSFGTIISILFLTEYNKYTKNIKLVFWEPTLLPWKEQYMKEDFIFNTKTKIYYGKNTSEIMNKTFYQECVNTKSTDIMFGLLGKDALIIAAKNSAGADAKKYFLKIKDKNKSRLFILNNTNHFFDGKKSQKELFSETINYLKSILNCSAIR